MSKPKKIVGDSLVRDLKENGEIPENMSVLSGFIGDGDTEENIHFYTNVNLRTYLIIPRDAILHQVKLTSKYSPVGGSMIWVQHPETFDSNEVLEKQAKYEFEHTQSQASAMESAYNNTNYFKGDVYNQYAEEQLNSVANPIAGMSSNNTPTMASSEGFTHNCMQTQVPICLPEEQS